MNGGVLSQVVELGIVEIFELTVVLVNGETLSQVVELLMVEILESVVDL